VWLYKVANSANEIQQATQRAFISIAASNSTGVRKVLNDAADQVVQFKAPLRLSNSGTTSARNVEGATNYQVWPYDLPEDFDFRDLETYEMHLLAIGPREESFTSVTIDLKAVWRVSEGERLFVWGWMTYDDVFPDSPMRLTEFCFEIVNVRWGVQVDGSGRASDPTTDVAYDAISCRRHNCYDTDCSDYERQRDARVARQSVG
jgi:hypothetical protein